MESGWSVLGRIEGILEWDKRRGYAWATEFFGEVGHDERGVYPKKEIQ